MKRTLTSILLPALLLAAAVLLLHGCAPQAQAAVPGDVDGSGEVEVLDARLALRASVGLEGFVPGDAAFLAADMNGNGEIEVSDARRILRVAVGLPADGNDGETQPADDPTQPADDTARSPYAVSAASYPAQTPYPAYGDGSSPEEIEAWYKDQNQRRAYYGAGAGLDGYFKKVLPVFLTGTDGENRLFSPMNVYFALGMLAEITDGASRRQVLDVLGADGMETLREQSRRLWLADYCDDGASANVPAASVWLSDALTYKKETLQSLAENCYASAFSGPMGDAAYDRALQTWINEQTGGLLEDLTGGLSMDKETVIALATTLYFRDKWAGEFSESRNVEDLFHGTAGDTTAVFMRRTDDYGPYYYGDSFGAAEIRLQKEGSMTFLLPDDGVSPEALLADPEALDFILARDPAQWEKQKRIRVHLSVPKFDLESQTELSDGLKALGVTDCFVPGKADFRPLTDSLEGAIAVTAAKHGVRVAIDEQGVTAAAYTVMLAAGAALPPEEELDFVLDRPFVFVIYNTERLPLFVGVVNQIN